MKTGIVAGLAALALADACSVPTSAVNNVVFTDNNLPSQDIRRQYRMTVPANAAGNELPIVFAFHGGGGRGGYPRMAQHQALAAGEGFIMVFPYGEYAGPEVEGDWVLNAGRGGNATRDVDFVNDLIDEISTEFCVDQSRIYATGYSLGSMFSQELACQSNSRFAAVASHAGAMPVNPATCEVVDNFGYMHIHGTRDFIIPYSNTWQWKEQQATVGTMNSVPGMLDFWTNAQNCGSQTGSTDHQIWAGCDGGVRVEHHRIQNGSHDYPSSIGGTATEKLIWDFLSEFSKN